jgi:hypothetical protein
MTKPIRRPRPAGNGAMATTRNADGASNNIVPHDPGSRKELAKLHCQARQHAAGERNQVQRAKHAKFAAFLAALLADRR